ncbi:SGNH/GDSL hydrolase family protein [Streptomyces sp. URMC 123]|uniref:SGNH/GDSL hydrolase family protein n=1 Tax=Streptomyces sp. URMC 123 TaxID=3423403 RepID=UPI003F198C93
MKTTRRATAAGSALLLSAGLALTGATAAHSAPTSDTAVTSYAALGDSYSSGLGAGDYDPDSGACKRSARAYPALWAYANRPDRFTFAACMGARTGDVLSDQLDALDPGTSLVSLTVGGNDAGFADVMTTCVISSESVCLERIARARAFVANTLPGRLDTVYNAVAERSPRAHVVVLGYPRLYRLNGTCVGGLSERERVALNAASDDLNATTAKRAADHGFTFAGVTANFTGHEICSGDPWIHSVTLPVENSYHPTAAGQSGGYLPAFRAAAR